MAFGNSYHKHEKNYGIDGHITQVSRSCPPRVASGTQVGVRVPRPSSFGESPRLGIESEEMSMKKKKLEVKIRKLEKIETTINRGGQSG
ncbi:hypothetical protein GCM10020001_047110 [Nonomuraea salmonea]